MRPVQVRFEDRIADEDDIGILELCDRLALQVGDVLDGDDFKRLGGELGNLGRPLLREMLRRRDQLGSDESQSRRLTAGTTMSVALTGIRSVSVGRTVDSR